MPTNIAHAPTAHGIQWVTRELITRGLFVSATCIRRYCDVGLVEVTRYPAGSTTRRNFTTNDVNRLEAVVVLKGLGLTDHEVHDWLASGDIEPVRARIGHVEQYITTARRILEG